MFKFVMRRVILFCSVVLFSGILHAVTVDNIIIIKKVVLDSTGFAGDLAMDPTNGTLHCIWPSQYGILKYASRTIDGVWSENEIIPSLGLFVTAEDGSGWLRKCCGITVDEFGAAHIVYGVEDGDLYYVTGNSGQWSEPYRVFPKSRPSCFPEIEVIDNNLFIIWEDASRGPIKEIFFMKRINGKWLSYPQMIMMADTPDLISSDSGILYLTARFFNNEWPDYDYDHNVMFSFLIPGFLDWQTTQVTHETMRVGKAPRFAVFQDNIYLSWSRSRPWEELGGDYDKKSELFCAIANEPGLEWDTHLGVNTYPIFTAATGDPYGVTAVYSDGTVFYAHGKSGPMSNHKKRFFSINSDGGYWSTARLVEWEDGIAHLASDGKTVWALAGSAEFNNREVTVSGYTNPFADPLDFNNNAPEFTLFPDTVSLRDNFWQTDCHASDPDGDPIHYSLIYGPQGCTVNSNSGSIQWQVAGVDTHVIGVKASDNRGKCDIHYFRLYVFDHIYDIEFAANPIQGQAPLTTQFTNLSEGPIEQYDWDFGDGGTSTNENPFHTYHQPGTYTVKLRVAGDAGPDSLIQESMITVEAPPVMADFSGSPVTGRAPLSVQFSDLSTGDIVSWLWDFGDDETSTEQHPFHIYDQPDTYTVTLIVTGPYGENSRIRPSYIDVQYAPPEANFSADPVSGYAPLLVQFTNQSSGSSLTYDWYFGDFTVADGGTSDEVNPVYSYHAVGDYTVILKAIGPDSSDIIQQHHLIHVFDPTDVEKETTIPDAYAIDQNYPNPFNLKTRIGYDLPERSLVNMVVYDSRGHRIKSLIQDTEQPGRHQVIWDGTNHSGQIVPTGIYLVKIGAGSYSDYIKVMLIK